MKILMAVKSKKMECLGAMYLSAVAKHLGHNCKIVEFKEAVKESLKYRADIVGFSVMTGDQDLVKRIIPFIRKQSTIIVGGPHVTFFPENFYGFSRVSKIIPGEAEEAFSKMLPGPRNSYPNHQDLDSIPWPDRTDFKDMPIRDFIASRGCPHDCSYCYNKRWNKMFPALKKVRLRSARDVVKEVASTRTNFAYFQDSCFGTSMKWLKEFSADYSKLRIPFHCHLHPNMVTENRVEELSLAGCYSVRIALESASLRLRKLINRGSTTVDGVIKGTRTLNRYGIKVMIQNIIGLPTATIEDDLATLDANIAANPNYAWVSIFQPYPGTDLGDFCEKNKLYNGNYSDLHDNFFDTSPLNFSDEYKEQLECLQKVFALCCDKRYIPKESELTDENLPRLVHDIMRRDGDRKLYAGVI